VTVAFLFFGVAFIFLVPLSPFSDMKVVFDVATQIAENNWGALKESAYMGMYPNNALTAVLFGLLLKIFPHAVIIKIFNMLSTLGTAFLLVKIGQILKFKYLNLLFFFSLSLISSFLCINHIYNDTVFCFLCAAVIFLYFQNKKRLPLCAVLLYILCFFRPTAIIFAIGILMDFFLNSQETALKKASKTAVIGTLCILTVLGTNLVVTSITDQTVKTRPVASYVYMGFNEEEFGFMDGSHSKKRTMYDVKERIEGYGFSTTFKILAKKGFWTWQEGTFQAQRYAFGPDAETSNQKFYRDTIVTPYLLNSSQRGRTVLNSVMRAQYIVLMLMLVFSLIKTKGSSHLAFLTYIILGFLLFYLIWEIKSKYLFPLLPLYGIIIFSGFDKLVETTKGFFKKS